MYPRCRTLGDQSSLLPPLSPIRRDAMVSFDVDLDVSGSKCSTRLETTKTSFSSTLNSTENTSSKGCMCSSTGFRTALKTLNIPSTTPKSSITSTKSFSRCKKSEISIMSIPSPISKSSPINYSSSQSDKSNSIISSSKVSVICSKFNAKASSKNPSSNSITSLSNGTSSFGCGSKSSYGSLKNSSITSDSSCSGLSLSRTKTRECARLSSTNNDSNSSSGIDLIKKSYFTSNNTATGYKKTLSSSSSSCLKLINTTNNNNVSRKTIPDSKSPSIKSTCSKMSSFKSKLYATCQSSTGLSICSSIVSTAINATFNSTARTNKNSSFEAESFITDKPMGSLFAKLLDNAGLEKYKTLFEKENIDALSFTLLKPADFKRLGITDPEDLRRIVGLIKIIVQFFCQRASLN